MKDIKKYDLICSIGINCACAQYLRKNHLRNKSGPLDWLISSDNYAPFKTILDEFNTFLDFSNLSPQKTEESQVNINFIHTKNKYVLVHDFFKGETIEKQITSVKQKYTRRITRLLNNLKSSKDILFVWYGENGVVLDKKILLQYLRQIREKYTANIDFLFILYNGNKNIDKEVIASGITFYNLPKEHLVLREEGNLLWDVDTITPIISSLKLKNNGKSLYFIFRGVFYRILSAFIFNKIKRHKFIEDKLRNN